MSRWSGRVAGCLAAVLLTTTGSIALAQPIRPPPVGAAAAAAAASLPDYRTRPPQDETVYFALVDRFANGDPANDRGGATGGRLVTGYDPSSRDFYQGGDLKGLKDHLDYIQGLGATALWISPVFRNKWVQGPPGHESAGYHGYWITDFTDVDPHFGTRADFKALVDAAHARNMKVYLDIVVNHTADVIKYRECTSLVGRGCPYRDKADYPYGRRGGMNGPPINPGFLGDDPVHQTTDNFARLVDPDYAYTPYVPAGEAHVKKPDWLNDVRYYHNRGDFNDTHEGMLDGDFSGLDDVMTENPRVISGFIDIYRSWIRDFHIDGYRIDTERHVDPAFWRAFVPSILAEAKADGVPEFAMFGEVANPDPAFLARHTKVDDMPNDLDFAFQNRAFEVIGGKAAPSRLQDLFLLDPDYRDGETTADRQPTFLGNHDMGRFAGLLHAASPTMGRAERLARTRLADALLLFSRGAPILYYGDEQGFAGAPGYAGSRETMFATQAKAYASEVPLGSDHAGGARYDPTAPLYRAVAEMTELRNRHPGLRRGVQQVVAADPEIGGLYAFTRTLDGDGQYLVAMNTGRTAMTRDVAVEPMRGAWASLHGACPSTAIAPGVVRVTLKPFDYVVCRAP